VVEKTETQIWVLFQKPANGRAPDETDHTGHHDFRGRPVLGFSQKGPETNGLSGAAQFDQGRISERIQLSNPDQARLHAKDAFTVLALLKKGVASLVIVGKLDSVEPRQFRVVERTPLGGVTSLAAKARNSRLPDPS
jgi:hypothetical protein